MPHSQYIAGREPPSLGDRILAHSFGLVLTTGSLIMAVLMLASIHPDIVVSRALNSMSAWVLVPLSGALIAGGVRVYQGVIFRRPDWSKVDMMRIERSGCTALALGWVAYGLSVIFTGNPFAVITVFMSVALAGGFTLRAVALQVSERRVEATRTVLEG